MTRKIRIGLAGLGRMGRIQAASLSARRPSAQLACVFDADQGTDVIYTVRQENR